MRRVNLDEVALAIEIDIELDHHELAPGERVSGAVVVARGGAAERVTVQLRQVARQADRRERVLRDEAAAVVHSGRLADGQRIRFGLELPADAHPSLGDGDNRRTWVVGARVTGAGARAYRSRDLEVGQAVGGPVAVPGATRPDAAGDALGGRVRAGWPDRRERFRFAGMWAIASAVLAGLGVYLLAFIPFVAGEEGGERDVQLLLAGGLALVAAGLAGLWLTVPRRAADLDLVVELPETVPGGSVSGTLYNQAPGPPLELAAVCRGIRAGTGPGLEDVEVSQSMLVCPADVDPGLREQRFRIDIPPGAPPTQRQTVGASTRWVMARRPRPIRDSVALAPITVRR